MLSGTTPFAAFSTSASDATANLEDNVGRGSQGFLDALFLFRGRESRVFLDADGFSTSLAISLAVDYSSQDESSQLRMCRCIR